jgi:membrane protein
VIIATFAGDISMSGTMNTKKTYPKLGGLTPGELIRRTWNQFWEDRILDQSAKLSFYFFLSLFPLLICLFTLLGFLLKSGPDLMEMLYNYLTAVVPDSASNLIDTTIHEIIHGSGALTVSFALLFTWWAACRGMVAIIDGLNIAYNVGESRYWWKKYMVASILTVVFLLITIAALLTLIYNGKLGVYLIAHLGFPVFISRLWKCLSWLILLAFVILGFNILYIFAPDVKHRQWRYLMPGTVVGVVLWLAVSFGFKIYLSVFSNFTVTYGSIGAVIILMMWFYLSGIAILVGGEVNSAIEKTLSGK